MKQRSRRQQPGQTIILLAFIIIVLVGLVGLSVDVGNTYAQERRVQSVSNAAALAGMHAALGNNTNQVVWNEVQRTMSANRIGSRDANEFEYRADYILADNSVVFLGKWDGTTSRMTENGNSIPRNIDRFQVTVTERVDTYFAGVVGRKDLTVHSNGVACMGNFGFGVYPLGVPNVLKSPDHKVFSSYTNQNTYTQLATTDARWGKWTETGNTANSSMKNMVIRLPMDPGNQFVPGVHISWLNWAGDDQVGPDGVSYTANANNNSNSALKAAWTYPGTLQKNFLEGKGSTALPNKLPMRKLQLGDWVAGEPGMRTGVDNNIQTLISNQTTVMLPIYDAFGNNGNGGNTKISLHMNLMGRFYIRYAQLTGGTRYIDLEYKGPAAGSPEACGSELPPPDDPKKFNIAGQVQLNRVYREKATNTVTRDVVIVMDVSGSMDFDWNDRTRTPTLMAGYQYPRLNDAKTVVTNFVRQYDVSLTTGDPDARIAFVTFSGAKRAGNSGLNIGGDNLAITTQVGWSTACSASAIANGCNGDANKWANVQSKATSMVANGGTPGPLGFERVEQLLQNRRTPPTGKTYQQVVLFVTDGVFNICGNDVGSVQCGRPNDSQAGDTVYMDGSLGSTPNSYWQNPSYNLINGRPQWQGIRVASRIKASGARVFVVGLTPRCIPQTQAGCFNPGGLSDMSSGSGYYYEADDGGALANIFATVRDTIENDICIPQEAAAQAASGATVTLKKPENPTWSKQVTADADGKFSFTGNDIQPGNYVITVSPITARSPEPKDGLTRTYSRVVNAYNRSEEGQVSLYIDPQYPDGATVYGEAQVYLARDINGVPLNACRTP